MKITSTCRTSRCNTTVPATKAILCPVWVFALGTTSANCARLDMHCNRKHKIYIRYKQNSFYLNIYKHLRRTFYMYIRWVGNHFLDYGIRRDLHDVMTSVTGHAPLPLPPAPHSSRTHVLYIRALSINNSILLGQTCVTYKPFCA